MKIPLPRFALALAASSFFTLAAHARTMPAAESPSWKEVAPGVWKATIGQADSLTLLQAAGACTPLRSALAAMPAAAFPLDPREIEGRKVDWKTLVRFPLARDEDVYGLGVDFQSIRRNGGIFELHVDHWNSKAGITGRTHAPVPLYVSSKGFAVLFDSARYLKVTVGHGVRLAAKERPPVVDRTTRTIRPSSPGTRPLPAPWSAQPRSDSIEVMAGAPGLDIYVFAGPSPLDAVRRYNLFCGGGALPPKWGLGFMARVKTAYTAQQVLDDIATFRAQGIPLDMVGLEPGWMDHAYPCSFKWDPERFPDPKSFLAEIRRQHVRLNLWFNPYVGPPQTPLYTQLLPYAGTHLVWNGIVPDYTIPEARQRFVEHLKREVLDIVPGSVGGFKLDEVDGYDRYLWPESAVFPSGHHAEQLRQTYGLLLQHAVHEAFRGQGRRTMGQIRGTNAGASPYPFVIYNDNYDFAEYITAVANSGFVGVLWSPEVRGSNNGTDMLRRIQAVCFSPLALYNGWASEQKLWTHPAVAGHIREAIRLRLRLLPYFYNAFAQYRHAGTPVIRPMQLAAGNAPARSAETAGTLDATANPYEVPAAARELKDQYFFGDSLLVAPLAANAKSRKVVLPAGKWFDFHTGRYAGENETIEVAPPLESMPVFVRDGALVPMLAETLDHTPGPGDAVSLEIRHYGETPGKLALYDDDGETFAYENGAYSWTGLSAERGADGAWFGTVSPDKNGRRWSYSGAVWRFMSTR